MLLRYAIQALQSRLSFVLTQLCTGRYGGGGVCLQEMLANADDVRATHFTILLDKSHYHSHGLLHDNMQDMQKPGLLVGNNAAFTEQDFVGYTRKIGNSFKKNDSRTAGQFGVA